MKTSRKYTNELYKQFKYLATWLPGTPMELGDIGVLNGKEYTKLANLADLGIKFDIENDDSKADIEHSSKGSVSLTTKASGTASPEGSSLGEIDAGITVNFSKENAILFKANGTTNPAIQNQIILGDAILKLYKEGKWDKDWVVITELVKATSATILISSSKSGKIELKAKGSAKAGSLDIADVDAGLELSYSKDLATKIIAEKGLTPPFKASKVKTRIFKSPIFKTTETYSVELMSENGKSINHNSNYFGELEFDDDED